MMNNSSERGQHSFNYENWQSHAPPAFSSPPPLCLNYSCPPPQNFTSPPPTQLSCFAPPRFSTPPGPFSMSPQVPGPNTLYNTTGPPYLPVGPSHFSLLACSPTRHPSPWQQQASEDKAWVRQWLLKMNKISTGKCKERSTTIKIHEVRQLLVSTSRCLQELRAMQVEMHQNQECEQSKWEEMVNRTSEIKNKLMLLTSRLDDAKKNMKTLPLMLTRRAAKRRAQQRRRAELKRDQEAREASRQAKHLYIDEWRRQRQDEVERAKREEDTRREADAVLGEVHRKQVEGRRWQQLLGGLAKLRQLRAQAAADRGLRPSQHEDECFEKVTVESESLTTEISEEQFWKGIGVWIRSPHVENRRLCGVKTVLYGHVLEPDSTLEITDRLIKLSSKRQQYDLTDPHFVSSFLESAGIKLQNPECKRPITGKPDEQTIILKIRQLIPKNKDKFQPCLEAIVLDGRSTQASFVHLGNTDDSLSPHTPYCCGLKPRGEGETGVSLEFGLWQEDPGKVVEEGAEPWLRTKLFPRLIKWIVLEHNPSSALPDTSLNLVDLNEYNEKYQELKKKYGPQMVEIWPEQTDPLKFVYEDLAIASYLLCVWGNDKPSFVDLGCGNGLLVHILCSEGHLGLGLDVRSRKLWALFPPTTKLQVCSVIPSIETTFPEYDWIIGNHSDELTPWIPVMAALSTPKTSFFVLPCCAYDFWGKYQRLNPTDSQYTEYIKFVRTVSETCGFKVEIDKLRIPSTKRTCLIGRHRFKSMEKTVLWEYVTSRRKSGQDDFTPRPAQERVRNCTKLPSGVAKSVVKLVSDKLLSQVGDTEGWGAECELPLSEAAALVSPTLKMQMKSECGGLQTLLRNHHNIFLVQGGVVKFREPKPSICTDPTRWKNKPCWFFLNHPKGCPVQEDLCSYDHK